MGGSRFFDRVRRCPRLFRSKRYERTFDKKRQSSLVMPDESVEERYSVANNNISSIAALTASPTRQGAVIRSVATVKEHKVHYGVQSATFTRTVFPGQASGTYRINGQLPTWQGTKIVATSNTSTSRPGLSPPIPYPPSNASAYYSSPHIRIIANPNFSVYG